MLKHGRFLQNLVVSPVFPKPIYQEDDEDDDDAAGDDVGDDENADE